MKSNAMKDKLVFVNKAISTDQTRPRLYMTSAYWFAGKRMLAATDGRRLHMLLLSDGYVKAYNLPDRDTYVKVLPKDNQIVALSLDFQFPNIERVTPPSKPTHFADFTDNKGKALQASFALATKCIVNSDYLEDLFGFSWNVSVQDPGKAIRFDSVDLVDEQPQMVAVVMPMQREAGACVRTFEADKAKEA